MKQVLLFLAVVAIAGPALAQRHVDFFVDAEGVRRSSKATFEPNVVRYEPRFDTGGGLGGGINLFFTDRVSLETKVAAVESRLHLRRSGSDFVTVADLGYAQIYPITALLQWHMLEGTAIRPYIGAGVGYMVVRNISRQTFGLAGVNFDNPTGLVVDGGLELSLSKRWSVLGDARYTPIETRSNATFVGAASAAKVDVKPLIVSAGIAFRF
jgi:outer membrane protein